jgi:hypothetical protein
MENKPEKTKKGGRPKHKNPLEKIAPPVFQRQNMRPSKQRQQYSKSLYQRTFAL